MSIDPYTLIGLVWMVILGPAVGNYATSVIYRLPKGETPFEAHPYCGTCGNMLQPRDLFPLWSFILNRGKCRFCDDPIRISYFVVELLCLIIFCTNFLLFGVSDAFLLITAIAVFWIILATIENREGWLSEHIATYIAALGLLYEVTQGRELMEVITQAFVIFMAGIVLWYISKSFVRYRYTPPNFVWIGLLIGLCLPFMQAAIVIGLSVTCFWCFRIIRRPIAVSIPAGIAVYVMLLIGEDYSQVISSL